MERNHQTLQNAIVQLLDYQPKHRLWDAIEQRLDAEQSQERLQEAINQLPTYAPPTELWNRIAAELEQPSPMRLRVSRSAWLSLAAATILAVISLVFWLNRTPEPTETVQMLYAAAEANPINADWNEDEATIEHIMNIYAQRASFLQSEPGETLISDLKELNEAKAEIQNMMQKYGQDAQLVRTIVEIERQRSEIVKKMAQEI